MRIYIFTWVCVYLYQCKRNLIYRAINIYIYWRFKAQTHRTRITPWTLIYTSSSFPFFLFLFFFAFSIFFCRLCPVFLLIYTTTRVKEGFLFVLFRSKAWTDEVQKKTFRASSSSGWGLKRKKKELSSSIIWNKSLNKVRAVAAVRRKHSSRHVVDGWHPTVMSERRALYSNKNTVVYILCDLRSWCCCFKRTISFSIGVVFTGKTIENQWKTTGNKTYSRIWLKLIYIQCKDQKIRSRESTSSSCSGSLFTLQHIFNGVSVLTYIYIPPLCSPLEEEKIKKRFLLIFFYIPPPARSSWAALVNF